jgi:hypothetical protein
LLVLKYETREITTIVKVIHHQEKLQSLLKWSSIKIHYSYC